MWQRLEAVLARNINLHHHFPVNNVFGSIPCIQASWFSMLSRSVTVRILNMCNWASLHLKILDLRKQSKSVEHNFCSTRNVQIVQDHALVHHLPSLQLKHRLSDDAKQLPISDAAFDLLIHVLLNDCNTENCSHFPHMQRT